MARLAAAKAAAMLVSRPEDVSYLSGFSGEDSYLLLAGPHSCLITDGRYGEQARVECRGLGVLVRSGSLTDALKDTLRPVGRRPLALQADHVTMRMHEVLQKALAPRRLAAVTGITTDLRLVKDDMEVAAIRRSIAVAQDAFRWLRGQGRQWFVGRTERQVAAALDHRMRELGASKPSFETIVAAGANSSRPHYRPGDVRIERDSVVLIDWGAMVGGYCSDLTRVVFTGRIPPRLGQMYEVVSKAQASGMAAIAGGKALKAADLAAREVIVAAGMGPLFVHSLGHGIGREIHEAPALSSKAAGRLRAGMVVTVEPGVYEPGLGGIRIEDDVLVTSRGCQRLSSLSTRLHDMILR
jgi:Xaa-Pro aminopeptidase